MDSRMIKLAKNLINFSLDLTPNEKLYVTIRGEEQKAIGDLVAEYAKSRGIKVFYKYESLPEWNNFWANASEKEVENLIKAESELMKSVDACFLARDDMAEPLNSMQQALLNKYNVEVHYKIRCAKKWCLTKVPTKNEAILKGLDYNKMMDTYLNSSSIDYDKLNKEMNNLVGYMQKTDKVHILAKGTNLSFSIKGLPAIKCIGKRNIPDGEVYTAPVRNSINGIITYNVPSTYRGTTFENVSFEFKDGKIIKASSNNDEKLNEILNTDEGARFIGEFSFGLNPLIKEPQNSILYDEKISGSIHLTPGDAYSKCDNGNKSAIHWDLVQIQTPEYGGGEIWFDEKLLRKDGLFIPEDLKNLNPENLLKDIEMNK